VGCMMPTKVALYTLQTKTSALELEGPMGCCKGDTCVDLCVCVRDTWRLLEFWNGYGCEKAILASLEVYA
jgi:hypothetical protein